MLNSLIDELDSLADSGQAELNGRFSKTGKGDYGEGQKFLGIDTATKRKIAKTYAGLSFDDLDKLIEKNIFGSRFIAVVILTNKFKKARKDALERRRVFEFYLRNAEKWNNWGLVDVSAWHIVGNFLLKENSDLLKEFALSENLWKKRIAIVSTYAFIRERRFGETLAISEMLLNDEHDLIHKAVGWMLREVGKRNQEVLELFLKARYKKMPRTMLRYAIEKFEEGKRKKYLKGEI
jgi:3-methyladenine DNA glycosylase AlkD